MKPLKEVFLSDTSIELEDGDRGTNYPKVNDFSGTGFCLFLSAKNVTSDGFYFSAVQFILKEKSDQLRKGKLIRNDIILTTRGTVGNVSFFNEDIPFDHIRINSGMVIIRGGSDWDSRFLYFLFRSNYIQDQIKSLTTGTAQPQFPIKDIRKLKLPTLDIDKQYKAGILLSDISKKILLNRKLNGVAERFVQAIFKSWFVDFDPVHAKINALKVGLTKAQAERAAMAVIAGLCLPSEYPENINEIEIKLEKRLALIGKVKADEFKAMSSLFPLEFEGSDLGPIPKGWKIKLLSEIIQFNPSLSLKKNMVAKYVDMKSIPNAGHRINDVVSRPFGSGMKFQNGDVLMARITPCLENGKTAYVDCLIEDEVAWGSTEFIVMRPKALVPDKWIYLLSRHPEFVAFAVKNMSGTSGRQRVSADVLGTYKLPLPQAEDILNGFKILIDPIFEKIKMNSLENASLSQIGDLLLPKLLAGEINLDNLKIGEQESK